MEEVEDELAQLALCATRSEDFDEDRAHYLLDLQSAWTEKTNSNGNDDTTTKLDDSFGSKSSVIEESEPTENDSKKMSEVDMAQFRAIDTDAVVNEDSNNQTETATNGMTLEEIESELAELARLATLSESFDEERAQYLLDLQTRMTVHQKANALVPEAADGSSQSFDKNGDNENENVPAIPLPSPAMDEEMDTPAHDDGTTTQSSPSKPSSRRSSKAPSRSGTPRSRGSRSSMSPGSPMDDEDDERFKLAGTLDFLGAAVSASSSASEDRVDSPPRYIPIDPSNTDESTETGTNEHNAQESSTNVELLGDGREAEGERQDDSNISAEEGENDEEEVEVKEEEAEGAIAAQVEAETQIRAEVAEEAGSEEAGPEEEEESVAEKENEPQALRPVSGKINGNEFMKKDRNRGDDNRSLVEIQKEIAHLSKMISDNEKNQIAFSAESRLDELLSHQAKHPEYIEMVTSEQDEWLESIGDFTTQCLERTRSFVPVDVSQSSYDALIDLGIKDEIARRVLQRKCIWLVRMSREEIQNLHHADLYNRFNSTAQHLDIIETAAIYAAIPLTFSNDTEGKKADWRNTLEENLKQMLIANDNDDLPMDRIRHPAYAGLQFGPVKDVTSTRTNVAVTSGIDDTYSSTMSKEALGKMGNVRQKMSNF